MRITQICDQLASIGEAIGGAELVNVEMSGLPEFWKPFVQGIYAQEKFLGFDRIWTNCIQEEAWLESKNEKQKGIIDENKALVSHTRKGKKGGSPEREESLTLRRKKDLRKVKHFACHDFGHYSLQIPQRRRGGRKKNASST
jgi:hypothetical protein